MTEPVTAESLTAQLPPARPMDLGDLSERVARGLRMVVLDDDPTGTQSIKDLPILTAWSPADLRWAFAQDTPAFFILTNSRSLGPDAAAALNREILRAIAEVAGAAQIEYVVASRSDSTLRGHFPLETDVIAQELASSGVLIDGVLIVPAYLEPGRITIDSRHWARTAGGMIPVGESEFAKDSSFGYTSSDLRAWVSEKTLGAIAVEAVAAITIGDIRLGGPDRVRGILASLHDAQPVVIDAVIDDDLRVVAAAVVAAESAGQRFIYRTGPSFVRARAAQEASAPIRAQPTTTIGAGGGLIIVGSHVGQTSRQLGKLHAANVLSELSIDVRTVLDDARRDEHIAQVARRAIDALGDRDVVIATSRELITGSDQQDNLRIARTVSAALVAVVQAVIAETRPRFVVAKGGITSSDIATGGLGIRRAWARGTLLPGIISLWEPAEGPAAGVPFIVFAGNVGDDDALVTVVDTLNG